MDRDPSGAGLFGRIARGIGLRRAWPGRCTGELASRQGAVPKRMSNTPTHRLSAQPESNAVAEDAVLGALPSGDALIRALISAAYELCEESPRLSECRVLAYRDSLPPGLIGSYVPVLGSNSAIHVGILSDVCSCDALA